MAKVHMAGFALSAHGKTKTPIDDSDFTWHDKQFIGLENGARLLCEGGGGLEIECDYIAIYREQPTPQGRVTIREKYYKPTDTWSQAKQDNRDKFAAGVSAWQALTFEEQIVWNKILYPDHMSGYNRFLRNYMLTE